MPKRVQLSRRKGWRKPENCVVVARPGKWGNPFSVAAAAEAGHRNPRNAAVEAFEQWLRGNPDYQPDGAAFDRARAEAILENIGSLQGKDLACWCPLDEPCHAETLLRLANQTGER